MNLKRVLTLDCEIAESLGKEDPRWENSNELTLTVWGLQDQLGAAKTLNWYSPNESLEAIVGRDDCLNFDTAQVILDSADLVITFNGERFDFPLLEGAGFNLEHARSESISIPR